MTACAVVTSITAGSAEFAVVAEFALEPQPVDITTLKRPSVTIAAAKNFGFLICSNNSPFPGDNSAYKLFQNSAKNDLRKTLCRLFIRNIQYSAVLIPQNII